MKTRTLAIGLVVAAALLVLAWWVWPGGTKPQAQMSSARPRPTVTVPAAAAPMPTRTLRVIDADGAPIPFASLHTVGDLDSVRRFNASGNLPWPAQEELRVVVSAQGFLAQTVLLRPETEDIRLHKGGHRVSGQVRDVFGGVVSGATVGVANGAATRTDDEGNFTLTVAPGTRRLRAGSRDYFPQSKVLRVTSPASQDFELLPGGVIEGEVVDDDGNPAAGAWVSYTAVVPRATGYEHRPAEDTRRTQADAQGRFRLAPLEPATYRLLARTDHGSVEAPVSVRLALLGNRSGITLNVVRGSTVIGQVEDERGSPVPRASVEVMQRAGYRFTAEVDDDGRFEVRGLHPGMYRFRARRDAGPIGEMAEVRVPVIGAPKEVSLVLERGAKLRGSVSGSPQARVTLALPDGPRSMEHLRRQAAVLGVETTTDDAGTFVFDGIPAGDWNVVALARDARSGSNTVSLEPGGDGVVTIDLEPSTVLRGTVSNRGGAIDSVQVHLRGQSPLAPVSVGNDGTFVIDNVPRGSWAVDVTHNGTSVPLVEGPSKLLVEDDSPQTLQLEVDTYATTLRGRIFDSSDQPVADALVEARDEQRERTLGVSDSEGRFAIASTAAALYRIDVTGPSGLGLAEASDLAADADVVVVLQELSSISGRVQHRNAAVRRFEVAPPGSALFPVLFADDDGTFELTDLKPGPATLVVFAPEGIGRARVELRPGANTDLVVALEPWAAATARVVDDDGVPVAGAFVDVSTQVPRKDGAEGATTDTDGRFELDGIGPGRTIFKVRKGGATTRSEVQFVDPGDNLDLGTLVL